MVTQAMRQHQKEGGGNPLVRLRVWDAVATLATVWQRTLLDAVVAPQRFGAAMSQFRRVSDMMFHPGIPHLSLSQIPPAEEPLQMLSLTANYGGMPPQDIYALLRMVHWIRPKRMFEIGTFHGMTTAHLALNSSAKIYTLDLPRELAADLRRYTPQDAALLQRREEIGKEYRPLNTNGRIQQLFGDSTIFDYRPYHRSIDLVLVDACHQFDAVITDSRNALKLLGEKGVVLWHDFGNSRDVTRALKRLAKELPIFHIEGTWLAAYVKGLSMLPRLVGHTTTEAECNVVEAQGGRSC